MSKCSVKFTGEVTFCWPRTPTKKVYIFLFLHFSSAVPTKNVKTAKKQQQQQNKKQHFSQF